MSTKNQIEKLKIGTFRGATNPVLLEFKAENSIVLIFGENGSGKSTIADAIDFVCNNTFGSLSLRSGTTPKTHIVSANGKTQDLEVEMVYGGTTWKAKLEGSKPVTRPEQPPKAFILRRADITRIMEAQDADRYKTLKEFITVPQIETAEAALREASKRLNEDVDQAIQKKEVAESTLNQFWEAEGKPGEDPIKWAKAATQQSLKSLEQETTAKKTLLAKMDVVLTNESELMEAKSNYQSATQELAAIEKQLQDESDSQPNADLFTTLRQAESYLQSHLDSNSCPVCSKPEPHDSLLAQIRTQLKKLKSIQDLFDRLDKSKKTVHQAEGINNSASQKWETTFAELSVLIKNSPSELVADLNTLMANSDIQVFQSFKPLLAERKKLLGIEIQKSERVIAQHNALKTHLATIDEISETMDIKYATSQRLRNMLSIVEEERKNYVQDVVDSISGTVSKLFARIHPDEPIGEPSFGIKPNTIGSLTMRGKFGNNNNVPPVAYYSEAHLDTLGLCVYMALAKQTGNALIVLDDILTSVDDPHLDRVIDLINDEAQNFGHIIITTHSRAWFDRVRLGKGMPAEMIELYGWDLDNGMNHSRAPLAVEELREAVSALKVDRQKIASKAGILLEHLLDEITLRYGSKLSRKPIARYTLGELADGIDKNLRKLLRVEQLDDQGAISDDKNIEIAPLIIAATKDSWIRNQVGAHFNPDAAGISDSMVKTFGENALKLADALTCENCHQLPSKNKSGSYWECGAGCGKKRLYPLAAPGGRAVSEE